MKLLYIADGRSPIALNWIKYFIQKGHEVYLVSTFPCEQIDGLTWLVEIPVVMSGLYSQSGQGGGESGNLLRQLVPVELRTRIRQLIAPLSLPIAAFSLSKSIKNIKPDLIHAMRIPYEGMMTAKAVNHIKATSNTSIDTPLVISIWGNDLTLHARSTKMMADYTSQALQTVDGLHTDCQRDMRLAMKLGFDIDKPRIVLPGGGGIQMDIFYPPESGAKESGSRALAGNRPFTIINPRGYRAYVRNDTFFKAISIVAAKIPNVHFLCPGMSDEPQAQQWVKKLKIDHLVELLPAQSRLQMAELFRQSQVTVSVTTHDGTPNSLLEAMACGCFPIVGEVDSLHEWIAPGMNGLFVDPNSPKELAEAILQAITHPELLQSARARNPQFVSERAEYGMVMGTVEEFYNRLVSEKKELY